MGQSEISRTGQSRVVLIVVVLAIILVAAVVVGLNARSLTSGITADQASQPLATPEPSSSMVAPGDDEPQSEPDATETSVVLTFAAPTSDGAAIEASGYVEGVVESGGSCELRLAKGDEVVTATGPATPDASTTQCGSIAISTGLLTAGEWMASLRYTSNTVGSIDSEPLPVEVAG